VYCLCCILSAGTHTITSGFTTRTRAYHQATAAISCHPWCLDYCKFWVCCVTCIFDCLPGRASVMCTFCFCLVCESVRPSMPASDSLLTRCLEKVLDELSPNLQQRCILEQRWMLQNLGWKGQSSRPWCHRVRWKQQFEGRGVQYIEFRIDWFNVKRLKLCLAGSQSLTAMGRHLPYGITQCYLPPDTSERTPP